MLCPLRPLPEVFLTRKRGIEEKVLTPNDIVLRGVVGAGIGIVDDKGQLFPGLPPRFYQAWENIICIETTTEYPQPKINDFHGTATVRFDGYLNDRDLKFAPEDELYDYEFTGEVYLVGTEHPFRKIIRFRHPLQRLYYLAAEFERLPYILFSQQVQVRISPHNKD